jgi:adenosylhomocysteine nucleosidase
MNSLKPFESILLVFAMKEESQNLFDSENVIYTGIGKINATFALTQKLTQMALEKHLPSRVINFGSCGSQSFSKHSLVEVAEFHQVDMDVSPLGVPLGVTPFDKYGGVLKSESFTTQLPKARCETADRFQTNLVKSGSTVVEMEAYALAKVCKLFDVRFTAIKHVTDGADGTAHESWAENVQFSAQEFRKIFDQIRID